MLHSRRRFVSHGLVAGVLMVMRPGHAWASDEVIDLEWSDLLPENSGIDIEALRSLGIVQHGQLTTAFDQKTAGVVTEAYNGKSVRIPGYLIPLEFQGTGMTTALLVPYVGACIHVPPPPPNQLIFVTTAEPYESLGLFEPVFVTGAFNTMATETQLAEVGYMISAGRIEPYS